MLFLAFGSQCQNLRQKLGPVRSYGRAVSGKARYGAGEDYASVPEDIAVMGIIIPADHFGEGIVAMDLGITLILLGEEFTIREGDGFKVGEA